MPDAFDRIRAALANRYKIEREIGSGGMATVYLADDQKHHRKVAVKVLRPDLAAALGADRFLREIEIAARLSHPHILPLYDSGHAKGFLYYVMPLIDGESLRARLARGGELPIGEAVRILREVVDALSYAHAHGVVHRDIKPDNVLLSGRHALVTDFGVAKAVSEATGRQTLTTAGVALGTPAYMAPEQAAAEPHLDHRVDIYAVGALAYELLTGRTVFEAPTAQAMLAAQATQKPEPVTKHRETIPPVLAELVMKCLAKKPADRWQSTEEILPQLEALATTPTGGITPTDTRPLSAWPIQKRRRATSAAVVLAVTVVGIITWLANRGSGSITLGRTTQITDAPGLAYEPALSPDGKLIAYTAQSSTDRGILVRQIAGGRTIRLTEGLPGAHRSPRWSADGTQIVFVTALPQGGTIINAIPSLGGTPKHLVEAPPGTPVNSPGWSADGRWLAYALADSIYVAAADGSGPHRIAVAVEPAYLAWSPDGSRIAYVAGNAAAFNLAPSSIWVVDSKGGTPVQITSNDFANVSPAWSPAGDLFFVSNREGTRDLYRVRLRSSGAPAGPPTRLTTGLNAHTVSLSADARHLAYSLLRRRSNIASIPLPRQGTPLGPPELVTTGGQLIENFDVSTDGRWLVFDSNRKGNADIYKMPASGGDAEQLTDHPADDFSPAWSPDGKEIAFHSFRTGNRQVFVMTAEGKALQQVTKDTSQDRQASWSPDGQKLVFRSNRTGRYEIYATARRNGAWTEAHQLSFEGAGDQARWSPDGTLISYACAGGMCIRPSAGGPPRAIAPQLRLDSTTIGADKQYWSRDGSSIVYAASDSTGRKAIWSVPIRDGHPQMLVPNWTYGSNFATYGQRIYVLLLDNQSDIWMVELKP